MVIGGHIADGVVGIVVAGGGRVVFEAFAGVAGIYDFGESVGALGIAVGVGKQVDIPIYASADEAFAVVGFNVAIQVVCNAGFAVAQGIGPGCAVPVAVCGGGEAVSRIVTEHIKLTLAAYAVQVGVPLHGTDVVVVLRGAAVEIYKSSNALNELKLSCMYLINDSIDVKLGVL